MSDEEREHEEEKGGSRNLQLSSAALALSDQASGGVNLSSGAGSLSV